MNDSFPLPLSRAGRKSDKKGNSGYTDNELVNGKPE